MKSSGNIPVLMYHEIACDDITPASKRPEVSPAYVIDKETFSEQMEAVCRLGYQSSGLNGNGLKEKSRRPIVITFDDGMAGNYHNALPVLKRLHMRGVFFVSTDLIGRHGYMSLGDLRDLVGEGMEVQSHGSSHAALRGATAEQLEKEIQGSKSFLEDRLCVGIEAFSWPHGSYSRRGLDAARRAGYRIVCTSDVTMNRPETLDHPFAVLGRIAVTSSMRLESMKSLLQGDERAWAALRMRWLVKTVAKRVMGERIYGALYRRYYGMGRTRAFQ